MEAIARFTIKGTGHEVPFTIIEGKNPDEMYLFTVVEGKEYKIKIKNDNGVLKIESDDFPFEENKDVVVERLLGLSTELMENSASGWDNSSEENFSLVRPGYSPDQIFVENKPFSLYQIVELINSGDIELSPDFQRNFIWDKTRQSKLIESILLGLPLPSIYLSQYEDGRLTVVDGLQRLNTIRYFVEDKLKLVNLEYLIECNGLTFSELTKVLPPLRLRRFGQTQIMCFVIDYRSPSQLKFDLFKRLNTGGKPLNNQEIRNCMSRPFIQKLLRDMVELPSFSIATDGSVRDSRMEAREAALRFIYFREQYSPEFPLGNYSGDMELTLDSFIDELNGRHPLDESTIIGAYDQALKNSYHAFGEYTFRKILPGNIGGRRTPVNKLMMLTSSILLSGIDANDFKEKIEFESLAIPLADFIAAEEQLYLALSYSTNAKYNMDLAFKRFKLFFDLALSK